MRQDLTDNECYTKIIEWMIDQSSNSTYINHLKIMVEKIRGKKSIEEFDHPRFVSIQFGYWNLFPFGDKEYREMALELS